MDKWTTFEIKIALRKNKNGDYEPAGIKIIPVNTPSPKQRKTRENDVTKNNN